MRLWTKDELIAEIRRLEAWTDDRESLVAENARLAQYSDALEDQAERLRNLLREARGYVPITLAHRIDEASGAGSA